MIPDRGDRLFTEKKKSVSLSTITLIVPAVLGAFGGSYLYFRPAPPSPYAATLTRLGISADIPLHDMPLQGQLAQLNREFCDKHAIAQFSQRLERTGHPRSAAVAVERFAKACSVEPELLEAAYQAYFRISDYIGAARVAGELINSDKANPRFRYLRGFANERARNFREAVSDYSSVLNLFPNLSNVHVNEFYNLSRALDGLGRHCDAITPLNTYISYDTANRRTQQLITIMKEYASRGNCAASYAVGADRIAVQPGNRVFVSINGVAGVFIIDTGATTISITPEYAARARLPVDTQSLVTVKTVGGMMEQAPATAETVKVGNSSASNVQTLVAVGSRDAFGLGVDGLPGMSFLARFSVTLTTTQLELRPIGLLN